jgi:hypothetical protein
MCMSDEVLKSDGALKSDGTLKSDEVLVSSRITLKLVLGESTSCSSRTRRVDELTRVESVKKSTRVCSSTRRV